MIRNAAELAEKVRIMIGDGTQTSTYLPDGSSAWFSDEAYLRFVSDAYASISRDLNWNERELVTSTVAGTSTIDCRDFTTVYHVDVDGWPLISMSPAMMYRMDERWETRSGQPRFYLMGGTTAVMRVRMWPTPSSSGLDIRVMGLSKAEAFVNPFDAPIIPEWLQDIVVYEAASRILESHGPQHNSQLAAAYRMVVSTYLDLANKRRRDRQWGKIWVRGEGPRSPYTLYRQTHIPFTGLAPGDAE
jgi:hypothetical protein